MNAAFTSLAGVIGSIAPTLATMLGGPLAGGAVTALETALGLKSGAGVDEITKVVQGGGLTPETAAAIRKADQDYELKLKDAAFDLAKLNEDTAAHLMDDDVTDRGSARLRESTVHDNTPKILAYVVVLLVIFAEGSMFFLGQPKGVDGVVLGRILGTLDSALIMVLTYYFGSSSGAARGQELLAQSGPPPTNAAPLEVTAK